MRDIVPVDPIAVFTHDLGGPSPLRSWPPVPAEDLHQGEQLAAHAYGEFARRIRSPRHLFATMWRDPDPNARPGGSEAPTGILLSAQFGIAPYELTTSLLDAAEMFNTLDRASLGLRYKRNGQGDYELEWLELEIADPLKNLHHFRSCWTGEELAAVDCAVQIDVPATRDGPLRFHLQGRLPRRYNLGAAIEDRHIAFAASGGAMPMPDWVMY